MFVFLIRVFFRCCVYLVGFIVMRVGFALMGDVGLVVAC